MNINGTLYAVMPDGTHKEIGKALNVRIKFADARFMFFHKRVASVMGRGTLCCRSCQSKFDLCPELVTDFVATGWPKCCGSTMSYDGPILTSGGQA